MGLGFRVQGLGCVDHPVKLVYKPFCDVRRTLEAYIKPSHTSSQQLRILPAIYAKPEALNLNSLTPTTLNP